jgi:hypothetical protein
MVNEMKRIMRTLVTLIAALWLLAAPSFEVSAKPKHHTKTHWWDHSPYIPREPRYPYPHANGWYPHDADKLPIGSGEWWRQMLREDRVRN